MKTSIFKRFTSYYKPYRFLFYFDLVCATIVASVDLIFPQVIRFFLNNYEGFTKENIFYLGMQISCLLLVLYLIRYGARFFITSYGHVMGANMERDMRNDLFSQLQKLSFTYHDEHNTGEMSARLVSDLFDIAEFAHHGPENIFLASIKLIGSFIFLSFINVRLTVILLSITCFNLVFSLVKNKQYKTIFLNNRKKMAGINSQVQDSLSGIRVVKSFTNELIEEKKFSVANDKYLHAKRNSYLQMGKYHSTNNFLTGLLYVAVIFFGCLYVSHGTLTMSDLTIFVLYLGIYVEPITMFVEFTEMFQNGISGFKRFCEILDLHPETDETHGTKDFTGISKDIVFDAVSFQYETSEPILKHLSLTFQAGKTSALVGPSGSGKTTICSLIPLFYKPTSGRILFDGIDSTEFTLKSLRSNIGIVQQDVYLFGTTIADNILYGNPHASDEQVIEAAKKAHIHDFITSLPNGYNTNVGERGVKLSGGQKQRIAIARMFLKNPPILILDEATSSLDSENEMQIQEALETLAVNRTVIVIAHRLSTIRNADCIYVITDEGLCEQGTHADLLDKKGLYASMHDMAFRLG